MTNNWPYTTYSKINPEVEKNFPFKKARENQLECISEIKEAIDNGFKYIILEAGTGTGKSAMAATLAPMFDSTYILTVTKQLQDQYLNDFKKLGFKLVKGKGNFKCKKYAEDKIKETCVDGRCVLEGYSCEYDVNMGNYKVRDESLACEYAYQKCVAADSSVVITNYAFYYTQLNAPSMFSKRDFVVFDEAHNIEDVLMGFFNLEFSRSDLKENVGIDLSKEVVNSLVQGDYHDWIKFTERVIKAYSKELDKIKPFKDGSLHMAKKYNTILSLKRECSDFIKYIRQDPNNWIVDYDKFEKVISFKPIKVDKYAKKYLFNHGDVCLFMSATILDYKLFAKWLGINEDEIYAIRQESPFDVSRNPIVTYDGFQMTYKNLSSTAPKTISVLKDILEKHKDDKGIIHTVSYQCKNFIKNSLNDVRLIDHKTHNRARQLNKFKKSKNPLVLISPSMNEGVDLPGNLCRFQIIYKIPYPSLADKQTKSRKDIDSEWYDYKTCLSLVQTYGRGMRHEKDYCKTYFIDSRLKGFISRDERTNNFLPDSFKMAVGITPAVIDEEAQLDSASEIDFEEEIEIIPSKPLKKKKPKKIKNKAIDDFNSLAKEIKGRSDFISDRELLKHNESDFISIDNIVDVRKKAELKQKAKDLEREDEFKAIDFYNELKKDELFKNDYYPYRRQCILFKNKIKDDSSDWKTIKEVFSNEIYLNKHQYIWLKNKILELIDKLNLSDNEINEMNDLLANYDINKERYESIQNTPVPIAERILKDDEDEIKLLSQEKYDLLQDLFYVKELGVGYIRRKEYDKAIQYYMKLLDCDFLYYKYHAYKQFARISREMKNPDEFKRLYEKYEVVYINNGHAISGF